MYFKRNMEELYKARDVINTHQSICFYICQALTEPHRRQLYQPPVSKLLLASAIVFGFGGCLWDGSSGGAVSEWSFKRQIIEEEETTV
jgi:hypothetical protein